MAQAVPLVKQALVLAGCLYWFTNGAGMFACMFGREDGLAVDNEEP